MERLLAVLDGQMRAIDRCANDFAYLNDSLQGDLQPRIARLVQLRGGMLEETINRCAAE